MNKRTKKGLLYVTVGITALTVATAPASAFAAREFKVELNKQHYVAQLDQLNNSGVSGEAQLYFKDNQNKDNLTINLDAHGTTPNMIHPVHIHGKDNPEVALCPTNAQDINQDGFVSVIEGATMYGPIKLNLTSPQTNFGMPPTLALFTQFAGTPDPTKFPAADANGALYLSQTYQFDRSPDARGALASLLPLENQHIVVHGANAPASVDADAFAILGSPVKGDLNTVSYDSLLPVACGEIQITSVDLNDNNGHSDPDISKNNPKQSSNDHQDSEVTINVLDSNTQQGAVTTLRDRVAFIRQNYDTTYATAKVHYDTEKSTNSGAARDTYIAIIQSARDHMINQFYEERNQFVDQMNKQGKSQLRDETTQNAELQISEFSNTFEVQKNSFLEAYKN